MNKFTLYLALLLACFAAKAQTINLEFPYFAGQTYDFKIFQGDKQITLIQDDTIPKGGKIQLVIPPKYKGYKGMSRWYLTHTKKGGGLDLVINNENFSITCLDSIPTRNSIVYKNTPENTFGKTNYLKQETLLRKYAAMLGIINSYKKKSKLYRKANKESKNIQNQYAAYSKNLSESSLYATKFRQIVNLTKGIGTILTSDEHEKANDINDFIVNKLDFGLLYTSHYWGSVIGSWLQLQSRIIKDDAKLLADTKIILNRLPNNKIYTDFVVSLTKQLTQVGKDEVLVGLIPKVKNSKKLLNYQGVLNVYKQDLSGKAPDLVIIEHLPNDKEIKTLLKTDTFNSKYTLLIFYRSDCGFCEDTMEGLQKHYKDLVDKGVKIVSISGDTELQDFKDACSVYPWADKFCNLKGMDGVNFKNYAVIGTPTMYLLNAKGEIIKRVTTLEDLLAWSKK